MFCLVICLLSLDICIKCGLEEVVIINIQYCLQALSPDLTAGRPLLTMDHGDICAVENIFIIYVCPNMPLNTPRQGSGFLGELHNSSFSPIYMVTG